MVHAVPCRGQWNFLLIYLAFYCTVYIKDNKVILFLKFCLVSYCLSVIYGTNINKKHVDNDVLIKFAILSESVKK